jgi:hypothetical protein
VAPTTVALSPNPTPGRPVEARAELNRVYQDAVAAGLDDEGARVAAAVALTEGGMGGALGDNNQSAGTFQLNHAGGQGTNYARTLGISTTESIARLRADPHAANAWALTGYLGQAIRQGQAQGLHGAALAEYAQRVGQVSVSPERAGANFNALTGAAFGGATVVGQRAAQDAAMPVGTGAPGAGALPPDPAAVIAAATAANRPPSPRPGDTYLPGTPAERAAAGTPGALPTAGGRRTPAGTTRPRPVPTGNEAIDNANWITWMREQNPDWVPPTGAPEAGAAAPRTAAAPREPAAARPRAEPNAARMTVSPSGFYRLSDGTTKSIQEMREGLAAAGWTGNAASDQDVLAAYARTTGKTVSPAAAPPPQATPEQRAAVARWTPTIVRLTQGTRVPADVVLAAIHTISLGDPAHAGGLLGVPTSRYGAGDTPTDPDTSIRVGSRILAELYAQTRDWTQAFRQYLALMGVAPAQMEEIMAVFNQERNAYLGNPGGVAPGAVPGGPFVPGTLVPASGGSQPTGA